MASTDLMDPREQAELAQAFERAPTGALPVPSVGGGMTLEQNPVGAKRVEVRRNDSEVIAKIKTHAAMAGNDWFYRFPVKKKGGGQDFISGPSIKLANAVARLYGNCQIDVRVVDNGSTWLIYAKFIDIETGFALVRPFQQDKGASRMGGTGPEADARRLDIALQIGVSKATRNVICNALATFCDFAFDEAEKNLVGKIGHNIDGYRDRALKWFAGRSIALSRVEAAVGRVAKDWLAPDLARLVAEVKAVEDGMATADDTWPPPAPPEPKRGDFQKAAAAQTETTARGEAATEGEQPAEAASASEPAGDTPADDHAKSAALPINDADWRIDESLMGLERKVEDFGKKVEAASNRAEVDAVERVNADFIEKLGAAYRKRTDEMLKRRREEIAKAAAR